MTGKDLYNAFSDIDEHFLWEREEIIREQNTAKKTSYPIRITIAAAACLGFLFMIYSAEKNTINTIIPESLTKDSVPLSDPSESNQNDIGSHAGEGNSIIVDIDNYEQIPKELIINSNLTGKVKYLTGIPKDEHYYDSTYVNETNFRFKRTAINYRCRGFRNRIRYGRHFPESFFEQDRNNKF